MGGWLWLLVAAAFALVGPTAAQEVRPSQGQAILDALRESTERANRAAAEARRRGDEAQRRGDEARQGSECSRALTAWINNPRSVIPPSLQERDLAPGNACRTAERYGVPFRRLTQ
jgi:hypothetical protein